jgi:hypothetical protein
VEQERAVGAAAARGKKDAATGIRSAAWPVRLGHPKLVEEDVRHVRVVVFQVLPG